jgi:hypothetical protein
MEACSKTKGFRNLKARRNPGPVARDASAPSHTQENKGYPTPTPVMSWVPQLLPVRLGDVIVVSRVRAGKGVALPISRLRARQAARSSRRTWASPLSPSRESHGWLSGGGHSWGARERARDCRRRRSSAAFRRSSNPPSDLCGDGIILQDTRFLRCPAEARTYDQGSLGRREGKEKRQAKRQAADATSQRGWPPKWKHREEFFSLRTEPSPVQQVLRGKFHDHSLTLSEGVTRRRYLNLSGLPTYQYGAAGRAMEEGGEEPTPRPSRKQPWRTRQRPRPLPSRRESPGELTMPC